MNRSTLVTLALLASGTWAVASASVSAVVEASQRHSRGQRPPLLRSGPASRSLQDRQTVTVNLPKVSMNFVCEGMDADELAEQDYVSELKTYYTQLITSELDSANGNDLIESFNAIVDGQDDVKQCLDESSRITVQWSGSVNFQTNDSTNVDPGEFMTAEEIQTDVTSENLKFHFQNNICSDIADWNANIQDATDDEWDLPSDEGFHICFGAGDNANLETWAVALIVVSILICVVFFILCCCCCKIC